MVKPRPRFDSDDDLWKKDGEPAGHEERGQGQVVVLRADARFSLEDLAAKARPALCALGAERAIVFGSYARGEGDGYSDLDLVIVIETALPRLERHELLAPLFDALPLPLDPLVYTPKEFAEGLRRGLGVFVAIAKEGITIYERPTEG